MLLTLYGFIHRKRIETKPRYLRILLWFIPLPYIACTAGWTVTEVGRQPWIVYGLMKTQDAVSPVASSQVGITLAAFMLVYGLLGLAAFILIAKHARKGPEPA